MSNETSKSAKRRKIIPIFQEAISGKVIDVGCGSDPLSIIDFPNIKELVTFDLQDGDANYLDKYFDEETFDCIHNSNVLEHLHNPFDVLYRWFKLTKVGGYIVTLIPDYILYEQKHWPSIYNSDHKHSFSISEEWPEHRFTHIKIIGLIKYLELKFPHQVKTIKIELIDTRYNYELKNVDQTRLDEVEAFIEFIIQRI
jgi:predicted SAM-dependent methyltransferase